MKTESRRAGVAVIKKNNRELSGILSWSVFCLEAFSVSNLWSVVFTRVVFVFTHKCSIRLGNESQAQRLSGELTTKKFFYIVLPLVANVIELLYA